MIAFEASNSNKNRDTVGFEATFRWRFTAPEKIRVWQITGPVFPDERIQHLKDAEQRAHIPVVPAQERL